MRNAIERRRAASRRDEGYNLVELLVAMTIFSILIALIIGLMITMMGQAKDNLARTRAVEQARLGLSQIDRQVRSGNLILDPALDGVAESGVPANYSLSIYTQEGGVAKCAQWRVKFPSSTATYGALEFRSWAPGAPSTVTDWYTVAQNVSRPVTPFNSANSTTWPPFWVDASVSSGTVAQNIRITLRTLDPESDSRAKAVVVTSVVTGRNTVFGYSPLQCSSVPAP
jgi:prepilin-type N-terminal cleavage/methylation domain-containing protein